MTIPASTNTTIAPWIHSHDGDTRTPYPVSAGAPALTG